MYIRTTGIIDARLRRTYIYYRKWVGTSVGSTDPSHFEFQFWCSWMLASWQWRRKIVEFRGAEGRRHAVLPCFSPANIEFIATNSNSPDDSLLLSWVHSDSLPSDSDKISTSTLLSILHLFASLTRKERCNHYLWSNYSTNRVKLFKIML